MKLKEISITKSGDSLNMPIYSQDPLSS